MLLFEESEQYRLLGEDEMIQWAEAAVASHAAGSLSAERIAQIIQGQRWRWRNARPQQKDLCMPDLIAALNQISEVWQQYLTDPSRSQAEDIIHLHQAIYESQLLSAALINQGWYCRDLRVLKLSSHEKESLRAAWFIFEELLEGQEDHSLAALIAAIREKISRHPVLAKLLLSLDAIQQRLPKSDSHEER